jgi:phosphate starvation-inducible PhoH-like protein
MSANANISFEPVDNERLANLCGAFDENLRQIETALEVNISRRGERFNIKGEQAVLARSVLERFYLESRHDISLERLQLGLIEAMRRDAQDMDAESVPLLMTRKAEVRAAPCARTNTCMPSRNTTSLSASARRAQARPILRSHRRSMPCSART